jgi:hypothetical protein
MIDMNGPRRARLEYHPSRLDIPKKAATPLSAEIHKSRLNPPPKKQML